MKENFLRKSIKSSVGTQTSLRFNSSVFFLVGCAAFEASSRIFKTSLSVVHCRWVRLRGSICWSLGLLGLGFGVEEGLTLVLAALRPSVEVKFSKSAIWQVKVVVVHMRGMQVLNATYFVVGVGFKVIVQLVCIACRNTIVTSSSMQFNLDAYQGVWVVSRMEQDLRDLGHLVAPQNLGRILAPRNLGRIVAPQNLGVHVVCRLESWKRSCDTLPEKQMVSCEVLCGNE